MMTRWTVVSLAAAAAVVAACTASTSSEPPLTGNWHGYVALHNEYGVPMSDVGVTVTAYSDGIAKAVANSTIDGSYTLINLRTGVYTLTYAGAGIGEFVRPELGFTGGGTQFLGTSNLSTPSTGVVTSLVVTPSASGDTLIVTGTQVLPPPGFSRLVRLFYDSTASVSSGPASYALSAVYKTTRFPFRIEVTATDLAAVRAVFGSGKTAYVVAYGDSFYPNSYVDTTTGNTVYPNVTATPSNVVSFVVP
jgi:hypothetical protein